MTAAEMLLLRADRYLASAEALIELGDHESAVSRSYYAMSYAARAALRERGIEPRTHAGVVSEFGRVFVKSGEVERTHLAALSRALNDRLLAEYDVGRLGARRIIVGERCCRTEGARSATRRNKQRTVYGLLP